MENICIDDQNGGIIEVKSDTSVIPFIKTYFTGKTTKTCDSPVYCYEITQDSRLDPFKKIDGSYTSRQLFQDHISFSRDIDAENQDKVIIIDDQIRINLNKQQFKILIREINDFAVLVICHSIRAAMDKMLLKSGYNLLHSGGFSFGEKNVLVLGDKGAGKTTTIVTALDEFNAAYISNDRMYVRNEKNKLHVIDREMGIKLASETIQHSSLRRHLPTSDFDPNSGKYYFNQIFRQIGAGRKAKAIATHMILPDIKNAQTGVYETDYNSNLLDKHVIVDCDGYNLYKLLLEAEQPEPIDFSKLNLKCLIAKGKEGIRAAISTIASE